MLIDCERNDMSIESLMIDTGMNVDMTNFEKKCYGMSEADIREQYMQSITARISGLEMVVMGILSDCQEILDGEYDQIRKQMNIAKFILSEIQDSRLNVEVQEPV
jgi:hypothetical protein